MICPSALWEERKRSIVYKTSPVGAGGRSNVSGSSRMNDRLVTKLSFFFHARQIIQLLTGSDDGATTFVKVGEFGFFFPPLFSQSICTLNAFFLLGLRVEQLFSSPITAFTIIFSRQLSMLNIIAKEKVSRPIP